MDETELVFVGRKHGSSSEQIAVLDFGQNQTSCQHRKSEISCSGYTNLEVLSCSAPTDLSATSNVPFHLCITKGKKYVVSCKSYNFLNMTLALSMCVFFLFSLIVNCENLMENFMVV
jgi:hypothetical protein